MKKSLLSILTLALVAVGCQNYDDQFDSLNTQITALTTKVDGLPPDTSAAITAINAAISALETTVSTLGTSDLTAADLTTSLVDVLTQIAAVKSDLVELDTDVATQISGIATTVAGLTSDLSDVATAQLTTAQVEAIVAVTDTSAALTAVQDSLDELLAADAALVGDLNIRNNAELLFAQNRIDVESANDYILQGNLTINTTGVGTFANVASATAAINLLTAKITNVIGNVTITTASDQATGTIDITKLVYVSGGFKVVGSWNADTTVLTTAAASFSVPINSAHTNFVLDKLVNGGVVQLTDDTDVDAVSPTIVDLSACTGCIAITTNGSTELDLPGAAVNLGSGQTAKLTTVGSIKSTSAAALTTDSVIIATANALTGADGSIELNPVSVVTSKFYASGPVTLDNGTASSAFNSSIIHAGGAIKVDALILDTTGSVVSVISNTLTEANITLGAKGIKLATLVASGTGIIDISAMTENLAGALIATAVDVNVSSLVTNTAALTINTDTDIQLPALESIPEGITATSASTFYAPKGATTSSKVIDLKNGVLATGVLGAKVTLKSLAAETDLADEATISELTLLAQSVTMDFEDAVLMTTLNYTGVVATAVAGQANNLDFSVAVATAVTSLTNVTLAGGINVVSLAGTSLANITSTGVIRSLTISGTASTNDINGVTPLTSITLGHAGSNLGNASTVSITNTGISSLDISTFSNIKNMYIGGNVSMTSMIWPSGVATVTMAQKQINKTIVVTNNGIAGVLSAGTSQTESQPFVETSFSGVGFTGAKTYIEFLLNESTAGGVTYTLSVDAASASILAAGADFATTSACKAAGQCSAIWGNDIFINEADELALLPN